MWTNILIALWYSVLFLVFLLLMGARSTWVLVAGIVTLALLVLYSFSPHHRGHRRRLFLALILPLLLLGIGSFVVEDSGVYPGQIPATSSINWIPTEQVQLTDMQVHHLFFMDRISGKIQNNSLETVNSVVLRFSLNGPDGVTEVQNVPFQGLGIAPGSSQGFEQTLIGLRKKPKEQWKWSFQVLTATGS